jgi:hypothetical protein
VSYKDDGPTKKKKLKFGEPEDINDWNARTNVNHLYRSNQFTSTVEYGKQRRKLSMKTKNEKNIIWKHEIDLKNNQPSAEKMAMLDTTAPLL